MLTVVDVLPDCFVLKYENVVPEDVEAIIYDSMFPRGEEGVKHTKVFINGRDLTRVNEVLEKTRSCMYPPFELAIVIDPRGAYTTAAAAVAKILQELVASGAGERSTRFLPTPSTLATTSTTASRSN